MAFFNIQTLLEAAEYIERRERGTGDCRILPPPHFLTTPVADSCIPPIYSQIYSVHSHCFFLFVPFLSVAEAEHGYASTLPCDVEFNRKKGKTKKAQNNRY